MLTNEEKQLLNEACTVYLQVVSQQATPEQVQGLTVAIGEIFKKIDGVGKTGKNGKPLGITDEWFDDVCKTCDHLKGTGCLESVTKKFPGKCDPILKFEQKKLIDEKKSENEKSNLKIYKEDDDETNK